MQSFSLLGRPCSKDLINHRWTQINTDEETSERRSGPDFRRSLNDALYVVLEYHVFYPCPSVVKKSFTAWIRLSWYGKLEQSLDRQRVGRRRRGNFARAGGRRGAHGVTRPTNDGLATGRFDFMTHFGAGTPDGADTGRNGREAALDMTTPHPQSLSPLRGEGSQWRHSRASWVLWLRV